MSGPQFDDLFVFHGARGEYFLEPMVEEFRKRALNCIEVVGGKTDVAKSLDKVLPHDGRVILITSAHIMHDGPSYEDLVGSAGCLSPIQVQALTQPVLTVYVPHDISTPFLVEEMFYIHHIDLYLAATEAELMLRRKVDVELVGWIKRLNPSEPPFENRGRALWLTMGMEIGVHRSGVAAKIEAMSPHIRDWCDIKLGPNSVVDELEEQLRALGANVIDKYQSAADLVPHYDIIVSNGSSSVVREAAMMGKRVYILTHRSIFRSRNQWYQYADLPNIQFIKSMDDIPEQNIDLPPRLLAFDMRRAIDAIFERL
ncbi:MAG: hypothetical protein ACI9MC_004134, partial [Kiritimatiellia bacterium]